MKKMLVAAALAAVAGAASAQGYVGALAGLTKVNITCVTGATCDDTDRGFKLYAGYAMTPNFGVEVGYTELGKMKLTAPVVRAEIKGAAFSVVGVLRGQFTKDLAGVARLGAASVRAKLSSNVGVSDSDETLCLYSGLGLEYAVSKTLKITGAADFTSVELSGESGNAYIAGVGLQYGF